MSLTTREIRQTFLDYFKDKEHELVPSAPIVIKDDPTLMFTNAGMNQFKSVFVGNAKADASRVADAQKCLRVSGKHNDLEEVGKDHYHHTMFEMLGNWSFGDYFKKEAIAYAWDLLTNVYKLDKERIYVSIFSGDSELNLGEDEEAKKLWSAFIAEERILSFGRKENFWEMGETGPCGPCSEIHFDMRSNEERARVDGRSLVNKDDPEVIEVWNLVFMQFNRLENGELKGLKDKHIDTGMGLERLARVLQGVNSNYEIDLFKHLIQRIEVETKVSYKGTDETRDVAFRVIADHIRAIGFCIADGQLPSNTGAGYVIRRVLRRAIRYGFSALGQKSPFIYLVFDTMVAEMGEDYPELVRGQSLISKVIKEEEVSFLSTLEKGLEKLGSLFSKSGKKEISGETAFELYDTFGFPIDLTSLISEEEGWTVDMKGFQQALSKQKERSRNATKTSFGDWTIIDEGSNSQFVGYDQLETDTRIVKARMIQSKGKELAQLVLESTPFYAESGGQIGDQGILKVGTEELRVVDTKKENNEIIHFTDRLPADLQASVVASVDEARREQVKKNHTATHLLHHVLREKLGTHVEQKGSLVAEDRLRFDFSHFERVSEEQKQLIEQAVEEMIQQDLELEERREFPIDKAKEMGAMALFGEKYGDRVRVIKFGGSVELCGGTHVNHTNEVDGFKILSESSVASGVRRLEAITGNAYRAYVRERLSALDQVEELMGNPKGVVDSVGKLISDHKLALKQIQSLEEKEKANLIKQLQSEIAESGNMNVLSRLISDVDGKIVKDALYQLTIANANLLAIIVGDDGDKPYIIVAVSKSLVEQSAIDASKLVRELAIHIDGGGGGQKFLAMAGGKNKQGLRRALENADEIIRIQAS